MSLEVTEITATLQHPIEVYDYSKPVAENHATLKPGFYELERIPNPSGFDAGWLRVKKTTIGAAELYWRSLVAAGHQITLREDGQPMSLPPLDLGE